LPIRHRRANPNRRWLILRRPPPPTAARPAARIRPDR